jgi:hypothetical protein
MQQGRESADGEASETGLAWSRKIAGGRRCAAGHWDIGWGTRIPAKTRVADQKPLACSAFLSSPGGRVGALWTIPVDHSSRGGTKATSGG